MIIWDKDQSPDQEAEALEAAMSILPEDEEIEAIIEEAEDDEAAEEIIQEIKAARPFLTKGFGLGK